MPELVLFEVWALWDGVGHGLEPAVLKMLSLGIGKANCSPHQQLPFLPLLPLALPPDGEFHFPGGFLGAGLGWEMAQGEDGPRRVSGGVWRAAAPLAPLQFPAVFWRGRVRGEGAVADPAAAAIKLPFVSAPFPRPLG